MKIEDITKSIKSSKLSNSEIDELIKQIKQIKKKQNSKSKPKKVKNETHFKKTSFVLTQSKHDALKNKIQLRNSIPKNTMNKLNGYKENAKPTKAETKFYDDLKRNGIEFFDQYPVMFQSPYNYQYILDFYIPSKNICIEIDGESHLGKEDYDNFRDALLKNAGITTIRFTNKQILNTDDEVIKTIAMLKQKK